MAETLKKLGESAPSAATATTLYTVPGATSVAVSVITVVNRSTVPTSFRLGVDVGGSGDTDSQWSYYDCPIAANETLEVMRGITLATTDLIRCYATLATLSFNAYGDEVT
jgi:hypothetical protein